MIKDGYSVFELELDDPLAIEAVELSKKLNNINLLAKVTKKSKNNLKLAVLG